jgi:hypothetical protein
MSIDLPQIIDINVTFVGSIVLFENSSDLFLRLIDVRLCVHGFHELSKTDATCLLSIKLCYNLIHRLFVGLESVLGQEQFQVVGQQNAHASRIVGVKHFLQVNDILNGELAD